MARKKIKTWFESGVIRNKEVTCFNYHCSEMKWVVDIWCLEKEEYVAGWCGFTRPEAIKFYEEKVADIDSGTIQPTIENWFNPLRN